MTISGGQRRSIPQAATSVWLENVRAGDIVAVWSQLDPSYQYIRAQEWVWANRHRVARSQAEMDELAGQLASDIPIPLRGPFLQGTLAMFKRTFESLLSRPIYMLGRDRPMSIDAELVFATHENVDPSVAWDTLTGRCFLMRHGAAAGWRVYGFWTEPPQPGWPPVHPDYTQPLAI